MCHVITHVKWLKEPVEISQKGHGAFIKLYADNAEHRAIAEKAYEQVKDSEWIELDTSPLDAPALPHSSASTSACSSSSAGPGSASAADGPPAPADNENQGREPVINTTVEMTLPDESKVQGVVTRKTNDLCWVGDGSGRIHEGIKRSDLRIIH